MTTQQAYFVGNSITDTLNQPGLAALATSRGNTHIWGKHMIPGSPLDWIWDHPADGFSQLPYGYYPNALGNYSWTALSLQPFDRSIDDDLTTVGKYVNLAKPLSPNLQLYLYQRWPRTDGVPALTADNWNNLWLRDYNGGWNNIESRDYISDLTQAVRTTYTDIKPALIVPVGDVFYALNNKMKAGQVPGYTNIWQLYVDHIHVDNIGSYIAACTFYATLYRENPVGLPVPTQYGSIDATLVNTIQQTIWDVVRAVNSNNTNPVATNDSFITSEGLNIVIALGTLLANDTDVDGNPITILTNLTTSPDSGQLIQQTNGNYLYKPNAGFSGTAQFSYTISDGQGGTSTATVSITVKTAIAGDSSPQTLNGTDNESDTIRGLGGNDIINGLGGNDLLNGGLDNDRVNGGDGNDIVQGSAGQDRLLGEAGSDNLVGGTGDDQLLGGVGRDRLTGNAGIDTFGLIRNAAGEFDVVTDFTVGEDKISISKAAFNLTQAVGTLNANLFWVGSSATQSGQRFIYDQFQGKLLFDSDGVGGTAPVRIGQFVNTPSLGNTDIVVVA